MSLTGDWLLPVHLIDAEVFPGQRMPGTEKTTLPVHPARSWGA
jgi:hypothetical protein